MMIMQLVQLLQRELGILLIFQGGGDPAPGEPTPNPDVSGQNIRYIFRGDQYTITQETEINNEGNFVLENFENGKFKLFLKDNSLEYTTDYIINFSEDNNTVFFEDSTDRFLKLERIQ